MLIYDFVLAGVIGTRCCIEIIGVEPVIFKRGGPTQDKKGGSKVEENDINIGSNGL